MACKLSKSDRHSLHFCQTETLALLHDAHVYDAVNADAISSDIQPVWIMLGVYASDGWEIDGVMAGQERRNGRGGGWKRQATRCAPQARRSVHNKKNHFRLRGGPEPPGACTVGMYSLPV